MKADNSKQMVKALALMFVLITTACFGAFALSIVTSNHVTDNVTVPEQAITITAGATLPDAPAIGSPYAMSVDVDYNVAASDAYAKLTIGKTGISSGDVSVTYGGNAITPTDNGDTLTFQFSVPSTDGMVAMEVTFHVAGAYTTDIVVEATA